MKHVILEKSEVKPYVRTRRGRLERVVGHTREGSWQSEKNEEKRQHQEQYQELHTKFYPFVTSNYDDDIKPVVPEFTIDELVGEYNHNEKGSDFISPFLSGFKRWAVSRMITPNYSPDSATLEDLAAGLHDHYFSASLKSRGSREKHYKEIQNWMKEWWGNKIKKYGKENLRSESMLKDFKVDLKSKVSQIVGMDYKKIESLIAEEKSTKKKEK